MKTKIFLLLVLLSLVATSCRGGQTPTSQPTPVEVTRVVVVTATTVPAATSTHTPTDTPQTVKPTTQSTAESGLNQAQAFSVRSVDFMKFTQDRLRDPLEETLIVQLVEESKPLRLTHSAISVPYDEPPDLPKGAAANYSRTWVKAIRSHDMCVWHRASPIGYKGFYDAEIVYDPDVHLETIRSFILEHPDLYDPCDIVTLVPEPHLRDESIQPSGLVRGINCAEESNECMFDSVEHLASWMEKAERVAQEAFKEIGVEGITIGRWGLDGFIYWGDRNDWWEFQNPQTRINGQRLIDADQGVLCMDHYFGEGDPFVEFEKIRSYYPEAQLWVCEWGPIDNQGAAYAEQFLQAARQYKVVGFNWWNSGPGTKEGLFEEVSDSVLGPTQYYEVLLKHFNPN